MSRLIDIIVRGLRADQPALPSSDAVPGSLYYVTDEQVTERVADDGLTWEDYSDAGGGGGGGVAIAAGTQTATTSTIVFSNSNGITFGMAGSTRITASHNGLTTAMASNAGSNFVAATAAFAGTSASGTIGSAGISISIGPYLTTAMQSNAVTLSNLRVSAGTTSNLLSAITFSNASGVSFGINASVVTASVKTDYQTSGNYLTTAMASNAGSNFVAATAAFAGTNASGTIASNGISVSVAPPSAGSVNFSAGTTSGNLTAVEFANSNGVSFGLDAGTITATVKTDYQTSGNYLTTAMASNRGSDFVQATAVFNGTNASGTIASGGISVSVGNYITTARASTDAIGLNTAQTNVTWTVNSSGLSFNAAGYAGIGFTSTTTAGTAIVGTHNTAGLSLGVPNFLTTALTTARASTDAIGLNTAQSNVTWTVNSSGLSFDARGYAGTGTSATNASVTLNSNGLAISVAAPGAGGSINISAGTTSNNLTALTFANSNGFTWGLDASTITVNANTVGTATTVYPVASANSVGTVTRWAAEDHRHAGAQSATTVSSVGSANAVGAVSARYAMEDHVHAGIGAIGISTGSTSGTSGSVQGTYWFRGGGNITVSQITSNNGSHTLAVSGQDGINLWLEPYPLVTATAVSALGAGSWHLAPFTAFGSMAGGRLNFLACNTGTANLFQDLGETAYKSNTTGTLSQVFTFSAAMALFQAGAGTNKTRLESMSSSSHSWAWSKVLNVSTNAGSNIAVSLAHSLSYIQEIDPTNGAMTLSQYANAGSSTFANSSGASTGLSTVFSSGRNIISGSIVQPFPFAGTLSAGIYWMGYVWSSTKGTTTTGGQLGSAPDFNFSGLLGLSRLPLESVYRNFGSTATTARSQLIPYGMYTGAAAMAPPATIAFSSDLSALASAWVPYFNWNYRGLNS